MTDDIELQLANLTIQASPMLVQKKENEYLYLCKKCKWNVITLFLTIGVFVWNGININVIVTQDDTNKETVHYLTIFSIIQCITWLNYLVYYCKNNVIVLYWLTTSCIGLNSIVCWGDYILLVNSKDDINTVIMINKIIVLWYQLFIFFQYKHLS
jgi:hypothetical protein